MLRDRRQRLRRRLHRIGEGQRPVRAAGLIVAGERRHLRAVEPNADRLPLVQRQQADVGDDRAALAADRLDIDRLGGIEHQPHRIGAAEQGRRRRGGKGECQAQAVAVALGVDRSGAGRRPWFQPAARSGGAIFGAASPAAAAGASGARARGLRRLGCERCFRRRLGLGLDAGLFG